MQVPRKQAGHDRRHSAAVRRTDPVPPDRVTASSGRHAWYIVSPTAKKATATTITSMPSSSWGTPKVNRACPVCASIPTVPTSNPRQSPATPRTTSLPSTPVTTANARTISANCSAGPTRPPPRRSTDRGTPPQRADGPATNDPSRGGQRRPARASHGAPDRTSSRSRRHVEQDGGRRPPYIAP
jgi:hypothetical protein